MDCLGLLLIRSGQLRVYTLSSEGREVTLYRLFEMDICLFSASCVMPNVQFEVVIEAEKDTKLWVIPSCLFKDLMNESAPVANYANDLISSRFSEVMWLMEQVMWRSFDKRLAAFLLEESALENSSVLKITHEKIAAHMGTAREVVTRMLRYFQGEGMVKLTRGAVEITDSKRLGNLANS
jgi:CRP/FNR family transcriptional regulator